MIIYVLDWHVCFVNCARARIVNRKVTCIHELYSTDYICRCGHSLASRTSARVAMSMDCAELAQAGMHSRCGLHFTHARAR